MKNLSVLVVLLFSFAVFFVSCQDVNQPEDLISQKGSLDKKSTCVTIQSGLLKYAAGHYLAGQPLTTGFDDYGYNYQAHMFNGSYFNSYAGGDGLPPWKGDDAAYLLANPSAASHWAWPYRKDQVMMKWNDAWISNQDCSGDGLLDRHFGFPSYIGSAAWLTNHQSGEYLGPNGEQCKWNYFVKIIAVPKDSYQAPPVFTDLWGMDHFTYYDKNNKVIGYEIWGSFAVIQEINNDACGGYHGVFYKGPKPGLGGW